MITNYGGYYNAVCCYTACPYIICLLLQAVSTHVLMRETK